MAKKMKAITPRKEESMTIVLSKETVRKADQSARRQARVASGMQKTSGAGVHGGSKEQVRRRDRHGNTQSMRKLRDSGGRGDD